MLSIDEKKSSTSRKKSDFYTQTLREQKLIQYTYNMQSGKFKTNQIAYYNQKLNPETHRVLITFLN